MSKKIIIPLTDKEISEIVPEKYISEVKAAPIVIKTGSRAFTIPA